MICLRERNVRFIGDAERVLENVRAAGEARRDLRRALEVQAVVVAHAIVIAAILPQSNAEEHVVRVVIGVAEEVRVVRGDHRDAGVGREIENERVELRLKAAGVVRLHLEVEAIGKGVRVPERDAFRLLNAPLEEMRRDLPGNAGGGDDQPFGVSREQLAIHAGLGVEALGVGERRKFYEVAIADGVTGEQDEMVVRLAAVARARAVASISGGDIRLHPNDRLDSCLFRTLLEVPGPVQISVVRDRERGLLQLLRSADQIANAIGAVEQRVFGMTVEMDE